MSGTNPVAAYKPTDCTSQTGTAYKVGIDANSAAALRIVGRFAPHAAAAPNMTVVVDPGNIFDGTTLTEIAAQTTAAFAAPASHPRIDRVVIDNTSGTVSVVSGAESTNPAPPAIPNGTSPVAQVLLQTSTAAITNAIITDERNLSGLSTGGFGAQASIASAAACDLGTVLSRNVFIGGTTTITSFGSSANTKNPIYLIEFAGSLTLKNGPTLLLPGGRDIQTGNNDTGMAEYLGGGSWRLRDLTRAGGSFGSAASLDAGTLPGDVVQLDEVGKLPAVDGSQQLNLPNSGNALVAIATQDASNSATLTFTDINDSYDEYVFELLNVASSSLVLRTSTNNGSTWDTASGSYRHSYISADGVSTAAAPSYGLISANNTSLNGSVKLFAPSVVGVAYKMFEVRWMDGNAHYQQGVTLRQASAAISAVQFFSLSGNITSGRITMYGIKHA